MTRWERRTLERAGECWFPGNRRYPSFRALGCVEAADAVLSHASAADRRALGWLLTALGLVPMPVLRSLMVAAASSATRRGPLGGVLRELDYGLNGLVTTLYFSGYHGAAYVGRTPVQVMLGDGTTEHGQVPEPERSS